MSNVVKVTTSIFLGIFLILISMMIGGGVSNVSDVIQIILHKIFNYNLNENISNAMISIIWDIRLPRILLSFIVGGMLSVSGAIMQSILRNPLASSYTIGVSSGASLGIGIFIILGITVSIFKNFTYPIVGFVFSILTALLVIVISKRCDRYMSNNTIILIGMSISLFLNSILTFITSINQESLYSILIWQMGSFSSRGWEYVWVIIPFVVIPIIGITTMLNEIDILTFGDEMCKAVGVNPSKTRIKLLIFSSILTGASVASSGVIGFVDLITPHICRRLFNSKHNFVIPMSFVFGGTLMVLFDTISRIVIYPAEIPISTINALIGTPIFIHIFFRNGRR